MAGRVVQGVGPELKTQYCKKKKKLCPSAMLWSPGFLSIFMLHTWRKYILYSISIV
jgi:hypothetical protein